MRRWFLFLLPLAACSSGLGYHAQGVYVTAVHDARPWPDLPEGLRAMRRATSEAYSATVAAEVFDGLRVELWPAGVAISSPTTPADTTGRACLYEPFAGLIRARVTGNHTLDSCLPHEVWEHRLPQVLEGDHNPRHAPRWRHEKAIILERARGAMQ